MRFSLFALLATAVGSSVAHILDSTNQRAYSDTICREIFDLHNIWRQRGKTKGDRRDANFNSKLNHLDKNPRATSIPDNYNRNIMF